MLKHCTTRVLALVLALLMVLPAFALAETPIAKAAITKNSKAYSIPANSTVDMNVGQQIAVALNGRTIRSAASSRPKSASVSANGVITARAEGKAKITIRYTNNTRFSFYVKVLDPRKPDSVYFTQGSSITIYAGQTKPLTPALRPSTAATTYSWKSSSKSVASVAGGVVTGLKTGTARITVTTANKKKATITVRVLPNKVDNINRAPTYSDVAAIGRNWTIRLKSVEIQGSKTIVEFYLLNGLGRSSQISDLFVNLWVNSTPLVNGTVKKISIRCNRGGSKLFKVTFSGSAVKSRNICLPQLPAGSRYFWFSGLNGYLKYKK